MVKTTETVGNFKLWQQAMGFTYMEGGILQDASLLQHVKPATHYCHDWMHGMASNGVANIVTYLFLYEVSKVDTDIWDRVDGYCNDWTWPARTFSVLSITIFLPRTASRIIRKQVLSSAAHLSC